MLSMHRRLLATLPTANDKAALSLTERALLNRLYHGEEDEQGLAETAAQLIHLLPGDLFVNGRVYFERLAGDLASDPAVVHVNHLIGLINKRDRLQHAHFWMLRRSDGTCPVSDEHGIGLDDLEAPESAERAEGPLAAASDHERSLKQLRLVVLARTPSATPSCLEALRDAYYGPARASDTVESLATHRSGELRLQKPGLLGPPHVSLDVVVDGWDNDADGIEMAKAVERFVYDLTRRYRWKRLMYR
jgi:hypothetical protein